MAENEKIDVAAALLQKISEKPQTLDHLLNIIGRLDTLDEVTAMVQALKNGGTDSMTERVADNVMTGLSIMDSFSGHDQLSMVKAAGDRALGLKGSIEKIDELERSGTLQALKDTGDFVAGFSRGMTDTMVERLAGTVERLADLTELLLQYNVKPLLDTGEAFINSGTLNDLTEFANGVASARRMFTDGLIDRAVGTGMELVEALLTQVNIKELINVMDESSHDTLKEAEDEKYHKGGILSLLSLAKDKEVMAGLKFMMILAKNLTKNLKRKSQDVFISSEFGKME